MNIPITCPMCGFVMMSNEQENVTRNGRTYCSIRCADDHETLGFPTWTKPETDRI